MIDKSKPYGEVIAEQQAEHSRRAELRRKINGQPNGYKPVSESDIARQKVSEALKHGESVLDIPSAVLADALGLKAA